MDAGYLEIYRKKEPYMRQFIFRQSEFFLQSFVSINLSIYTMNSVFVPILDEESMHGTIEIRIKIDVPVG